ncbi:MAG TPA: AAA family ATPase [Verrucomicrobiales bacterium]|nr:AAA family ATPase [Verrucomicrobiales bacterium]
MSARLDASESPVVTTAQAREAADRLGVLVAGLSEIILGKEDVLRLAVTCLLARGHLLFEDLPGVGKTLLSQALAQALGLRFRRVQFTSDLLPADILGANMYDRQSGGFVFHPGPVFAQVLLADEINRATPKTQSALLEAMEEGRVTCDGESHALPAPFFVIATQNPSTQMGTFMLPESQLDRFLMRLALGVPDRAAERSILQGRDRREALREMRQFIEKNAEYVGPRFAAEARKMHKGEADERSIYGEASDEEAEALKDEGIEFGRIPWPKYKHDG